MVNKREDQGRIFSCSRFLRALKEIKVPAIRTAKTIGMEGYSIPKTSGVSSQRVRVLRFSCSLIKFAIGGER